MNLLVKPNSYPWNRYHQLLKALLASPNSSISLFSSSSSSSSPQIDSLEGTKSKVEDDSLSVVSILDEFRQSGKQIKRYNQRKFKLSAHTGPLTRKILNARDSSRSMLSILDRWNEEGSEIKLSELHNLTKKLRQRCRFIHALQVAEWMSDKKGFNLLPEHFAVRLDLISRVHGLEQAEEYFNSISDTSKGYQVYVVLLICYANAKLLEKAEILMQKMRDMGIILTPYAYNVMLNLYSKMGKYEKLDLLVEEMEEKGIKHDVFTYEIRLHAYGASGDIEGMEKLLTKINMDPEIQMSFRVYTFAAYGYLKAGLIDKAMASLKESERLAKHNLRRYEKLLTLYATCGNKAEVYRVWNLYKQKRSSNTGYIAMISSLVKLDDMDGAEKIWEEWDSSDMKFDIQVPNLMICAYSRKGCWEKAEEYINKIMKRGNEPDASSWEGLATGYLIGGRILEAVETIKKAINSTNKPGWSPCLHTLAAYRKYLEGQGDSLEAAGFRKIIGQLCNLSTNECNRLFFLDNDEKFTSNGVESEMEDDQICIEPPTALAFSDKRSKVW